jgi:hypothetical protein
MKCGIVCHEEEAYGLFSTCYISSHVVQKHSPMSSLFSSWGLAIPITSSVLKAA